MMDLTDLKQEVKDLVEDITGLSAYYDIVPLGTREGVFLSMGDTTFSGRTIDGNAHIPSHSFDIFIVTYDGADTADNLVTTFVNATDGKSNDDFQLIMVNNITPLEYDPEFGFWGYAVNIEFKER